MRQISKLFFIMMALFFLQTNSTFAQIGGAVNGVGHIALWIAGGSKQSKQEKVIDQSTQHQKIAGSNVSVLRVKETDIKSKAKEHIIALQNRLNQYSVQYKNNQPVDVPKNDSDLLAIQNIDENWPTEYYAAELKAYKRYAFQQKQQTPAAPADSLNTLQNSAVKKDTASAKL